MSRRSRPDPLLVVALFALGAALLLGSLAALDLARLRDPEPRLAEPWRAEALVTPAGARASAAPRGGRIEADGSLTILSAPPTPGKAEPFVAGRGGSSNEAKPFDPVPAAIMGGVRALFRLIPEPPDERDGMIITTLERRVSDGRLVLARGCLRFGSASGPLAILPPGSRFGLRDGWLVVGPPGLPPARSARVGEVIFWEDEVWTRFDEGTRRRVAERCGPGPLAYVLPWSASVRQVDQDSFRAEEVARDQRISWREAYEQVRTCGDRNRETIARHFPRREPPTFVESCHFDAPGAPVVNPGNCPGGTQWKAGNCVGRNGAPVPVPPPPNQR